MGNEEFENEDYDTSESDYLDDYEDDNTEFDDGLTAESFAQRYPGANPRDFEEYFVTQAEYDKAVIDRRVEKRLSGLAPAIPPPIEDPRERDDFYIEKSKTINTITEYREKEERAKAAGDLERARECRQIADSFEKDFYKLESEHPTPAYTEALAAGLKQYQADLDNAVNNPDDFEKRRASSDDVQFYRDVQQRVKTVNQASDDNVLYFLMGDSQHGRRPDFYVSKVELPPGQKEKIMREAEFKGTLYDRLTSYGYVEPMAPPVIDDDNLDAANPNDMSQEQYERWRESHGAKPKYISPLAGIARQAPK